MGCGGRRSRAPRLGDLPRHQALDTGSGTAGRVGMTTGTDANDVVYESRSAPNMTTNSGANEANENNNHWLTKEADRLCVTSSSRAGTLLRSHAALSADCTHVPPGSPRTRRMPRESRRVSMNQAGDYVQLNQYKLLDSIGQGSYGIVKLAYNEEDETHYAMKILSKRKLMRRAGLFGRPPPRRPSGPPPDPLQRLYREIAILKKLDHDNVVKLVEVLDDPAEDQLYLVFELLEGGPILEVPTLEPLSEDVARNYFRDALLGIEYLHYQRICHRDIKPANLLLSTDGERWRVQVADLGVCDELRDDDSRLSGTVGTPAFRAPEAHAAAHAYDGKAADIWSLGVTLYSMVHGKVPWAASTIVELQDIISKQPLEFPSKPSISTGLKNLISWMLQKDPEKRANMKEIKEHPWTTKDGISPMPSEDENCRLVEVTEEDMAKVVTSIPNLATLILIKTMLKKHSFQNPFSRSREGSSGRSECSDQSLRSTPSGVRPGLARAGRSISAPGNYLTESSRQQSFESSLPSVTEVRDSLDIDSDKQNSTTSDPDADSVVTKQR